MTDVSAPRPPGRVDLAREAAFDLGQAHIRPAICEVQVGEDRLKLQPRVMQVLVALVRARGEVVSRDELVERCWGGLIVGDDSINRCIVRLRRLAEVEAPGAFQIETLARVGYRLTCAPEDAPPPQPGAKAPWRLPRRTWPWAAGAGALIAAAAIAILWLTMGAQPPASGIAVMPFDVAADDPASRNFANGVADEIASSLSQADLKSVPPGASGSLAAPQRDAAALRLGAAFALSGRVDRDGANLDVNVAVDDARRHAIVWSASFSDPASQAQSLKQKVASQTAAVLHCTLDASSFESGRMDDEGMALYLRACNWLYGDNFSAEGPALFRKVVEREPRFAAGWAKFAIVTETVGQSYPPDQAAQATREARAAAEKALELDPKQGDAYAALASAIPADHLWEQQGVLLKGLAAAPDNADLNYMEAGMLGDVGRLNASLAYSQRAVTLDPAQFDFVFDLITALAVEGRLGEARAMIDHALATWPGNQDIREIEMTTEARFGDPDRALALLNDPKWRPAEMTDPLFDDWRRFALLRKTRDPKQAAAYIRGVMDQVASGKMDPSMALVRLNSLGATDDAFAVAEKAGAAHLDTGGLFRSTPDGKVMWRDPRFLPLASRLGLVDFWRRSGQWPDFCQGPSRPYDCQAEAARLHLK